MVSSRDRTYLYFLLVIDGIAVMGGWIVYNLIRQYSGLFPPIEIPFQTLPMFVIGAYWLIVFWIFGMYRNLFAQSRLDELLLAIKTITIGSLILFFLIFLDDAVTNDPSSPRLKIVVYWLVIVAFVGTGRIALRSIRRRMLVIGVGTRNTILIGTQARAQELADTLKDFPGLGYNLLGYVSTEAVHEGDGDLACLGTLDALESVIADHKVDEIILVLNSSEHEQLLEIIGRAAAYKVTIKIRPDLYDIVSGQARTNQLYGVPLIEVSPQLMKPVEAFVKRSMDILVSSLVLLLGSPLFILIAVAVKATSKGPVFYTQERTGKDEKVFTMYKFRTMTADAEKKSGPQWAVKNDPRVTPLGKFLRKSHLDELPQAINVLQGDMSLVGPRPERPFFVNQFIEEIPLYRRRLNVRPGITGWAQVKHVYDASIEDVKTKLSFDLFYIENMSIRMDLKIIFNTFFRMIAGKGQA
ncbi:MAG: exopolysaccharide biosynthesis polyprenyl glycosylphosphotransferase [Ectothiorhodospiraceae bacterium]|nr:exopolysaccharide biosynthesis polyprenyl glycosylphosphotransferase [Ectothiorhodospiraceae bacterium]